jgi:Acyl-CoA synthetases (AMP-forming)/AMP-acid ligases II
MNFNSIVEAIRYHAAKNPGKLCLADGKGEVSYGAYYKRICGAAASLLERGIKPGDRVVAVASQTIDFLVLCHAVQMMGGLFVPLEKNVAEERICEIITKTDAALFVGNAAPNLCPCMKLTELSQLETDTEPCRLPDADADSMILFSTGTTGKSKGILLTHGSEVAVAENVKYGLAMKEDNIEIIPVPINHSNGLRRYFGNIVNGSAVVLLDGVVFVNRLFEMLDRYHATAIAMIPAALSIVFKLSGDRLGEYNGRLDYIQLGSAALPEADKNRLLRLLPDCRLYNMYGTTEAGCACVLNFNSDENRPECIGRPTCNSSFLFVDESGDPVEATPDNPGYLACSGGMCMKGYYKEPELTAEALRDGYLYTKDMGYIDGEGLIYMLGRADDIINTGGNKIAPVEIEEIARLYSGVTDCACVPVKDPVMGQLPRLFIVADKAFDTQGLYEYLASKLEKFKLPKSIAIIPEIPRTYNGKILRKKLAELQ